MKIIIEYDNNKLKTISEKLVNLFLNNNYDVMLLNNTYTQEEKNNLIKNDNNYFLLSNKLNSNNGIDIIYPLKDNDKLAKDLYDKLEKIITVNKYYQLRSSSITNLDYYEVFRNIRNNNAIIIKYGDDTLNNQNIAQIIYQVINSYLNNENVYVVKSGDSLYAIARKYNTSVDELKRINNLTSNLLSIGQKLIIPDDETIINYTVIKGDSLYAIAKKYNTSIDKIKKDNNLTSNLLSIGQKLIIKK